MRLLLTHGDLLPTIIEQPVEALPGSTAPVPAFRPDIESIGIYIPGKPIEDVMREYGLSNIIKLASNECPEEPFPPVQDAIAKAALQAHRYPDTLAIDLTAALAAHHGVPPSSVWVGPGSSPILISIAHAMGSAETSAVFADRSFILYRIITGMTRSAPLTVALDSELRHDPDGMLAAIRDDTTVVYVCNPNNPTGTYITPDAIDHIVAGAPERALVVIDEAYEEYVTHSEHRSAIPHAVARDNVVVLRTFSKIYGLAGLRVGYAIGHPDTIANLRRLQAPFAISNVSLAAAQEALRHQNLVSERAKTNAMGREQLASGLDRLGVGHTASETNFLLIHPEDDPAELCEFLLRRGVIVRQFGRYIRVTIGTETENARFLETLGEILQ